MEAKARALRRQPDLRLRLETIKDVSLERYVAGVEQFYAWCRKCGFRDVKRAKWPRKCALLQRYLSFLFDEKRPLPDGKAAVFGLQKLEAGGDKSVLREARSLGGLGPQGSSAHAAASA